MSINQPTKGGLPPLTGLPKIGGGGMGIKPMSLPKPGGLKPEPNVMDAIEHGEDDNFEQRGANEDKLVDEAFASIHAGRKQQQEAIELANDSEFWCAMYFQTRDQKEEFLRRMGWLDIGDKYLDGQVLAKVQGIELPERPAKYKVGKLDKKLSDLT
jgi:hypothetical protein